MLMQCKVFMLKSKPEKLKNGFLTFIDFFLMIMEY